MPTKAELRRLLRSRLEQTMMALNRALQGRNLASLEPVLSRLGRRETFREAIPEHELESLLSIAETQPQLMGIVDAADNWVLENYQDAARLPNDNEWRRLLTSPLNGQIGMSFALQWRYNFGRVFRENG